MKPRSSPKVDREILFNHVESPSNCFNRMITLSAANRNGSMSQAHACHNHERLTQGWSPVTGVQDMALRVSRQALSQGRGTLAGNARRVKFPCKRFNFGGFSEHVIGVLVC
jgi:hypothetical protein